MATSAPPTVGSSPGNPNRAKGHKAKLAPRPADDPLTEHSASVKQQLEQGSLTFDVPVELTKDKTVRAQAAIAAGYADSLQSSLTHPERASPVEQVQISDRVEMKLEPDEPGSVVTSMVGGESAAERYISPGTPALWEWDVTAKKEGEHILHLVVIAKATLQAKNLPPRDITVAVITKDKAIRVKVAPRTFGSELNSILGWAVERWDKVLEVILIPVFGFIAHRVRAAYRRKRIAQNAREKAASAKANTSGTSEVPLKHDPPLDPPAA